MKFSLQKPILFLKYVTRIFSLLKRKFRRYRYGLYRFHRRRRLGFPQKITQSGSSQVCMNCGVSFFGSYCYNCGQNRRTRRLSWSNFIENLLAGLTNVSRGFGFTIIGLFTRPGYLIEEFIRGKRVIYTKPFQMLFVLATAYALLFHLLYPEESGIKEQKKEQKHSMLLADSKNAELTMPQNRELRQQKILSWQEAKKIDSLTARMALTDEILDSTEQSILQKKVSDLFVEKKLRESEVDVLLAGHTPNKGKIRTLNKKVKAFTLSPFFLGVEKLLNKWNDNLAFTTILFLPFIALGTKWSFRKSKTNPRLNFIECLFACAYISLQGLILSILFLPFPTMAYENHSMAVQSALTLWSYKELFRFRIWGSVWRLILSYTYAILAIILLAIAIIGMGIWWG